jgi:hypothetical protein
LAKAFEQDGNLRQPLLAGVHFAQQLGELRHNPPLLCQRSYSASSPSRCGPECRAPLVAALPGTAALCSVTFSAA